MSLGAPHDYGCICPRCHERRRAIPVEKGCCTMTDRPDEKLRERFKEWTTSLPKCISDSGGCDGDLVGLEHEANCPMYGKEFATLRDAFDAGFQAGQAATRRECAEFV